MIKKPPKAKTLVVENICFVGKLTVGKATTKNLGNVQSYLLFIYYYYCLSISYLLTILINEINIEEFIEGDRKERKRGITLDRNTSIHL